MSVLAGSSEERPEQGVAAVEFVAHSSAHATSGEERFQAGMAGEDGVVDLGGFQTADFFLEGAHLFLPASRLGVQGEGNHRAIFEHMFDCVNVH